MPVLNRPLSVFISGVCLFALGACDSRNTSTPDAGASVDAGSDAGTQPPPPVIPEGHELLTPSDTQSHRFSGPPPFRAAFIPEAGRHYDLFGPLEQCFITLRDPSGATLERRTPSADPLYRPIRLHWSGLTGGAVYTVELDTSSGCSGEFYFVDRGVDDYGDMLALVTPAPTPGQAFTGVSEHSGEMDLASFGTVAGHIYSLDCTLPVTPVIFRPTWTVGFLTVDGTFYDSTQSPSGEETRYSSAFKATGAEARVYVTNNRIDDAPVPYNCMLRDLGPDDHGDTVQSATVLAAGTTSVQGTFETPRDPEVFALSVIPHHLYRVSCNPGGLHVCDVYVSPSVDTPFKGITSTGFKTTGSLEYLLLLGRRKNPQLGWVAAPYALELEDLGEVDHGDTPETATPLTGTTQQVQGHITFSGDEDLFSFQATEGGRYRFQLTWAAASANEPPQAYFLDASGSGPHSSYESTGPRQAIQTVTAPKTGTYYIKLYSFTDVGDYTLQFDALAP